MQKYYFLFILFFGVQQFVYSQSVGIGTNSPNVGAILELQSTNKGLLIPRTDTATINALGTPANALLIYQVADSAFYYFDGIKWRIIASKNSSSGVSLTLLNKVVFKKIINGSVPEIWTANYDGTGAGKVNITLPVGISYSDDMIPVLSPNGLKIFFTAGTVGSYTGDLYSCNADGSGVLKIVDKGGTDNNIILGGAY